MIFLIENRSPIQNENFLLSTNHIFKTKNKQYIIISSGIILCLKKTNMKNIVLIKVILK